MMFPLHLPPHSSSSMLFGDLLAAGAYDVRLRKHLFSRNSASTPLWETLEEDIDPIDFTLGKHHFSMNSKSTPLWETVGEKIHPLGSVSDKEKYMTKISL